MRHENTMQKSNRKEVKNMKKTIFMVMAIAVSTLLLAMPVWAVEIDVLYDFDADANGYSPRGGVVLHGTNLYGTAANEPTSTVGTIYKYDILTDTYTKLHTFTGSPFDDGGVPLATPVVVGNTVYGTTLYGGNLNLGTVWKIDTDGTDYSVLYEYTNGTDTNSPRGISYAEDRLWVVSAAGGTAGSLLSLNLDGSDPVVTHQFDDPDGSYIVGAPLVKEGVVYGTAYGGGANGSGTLWSVNTDGTGFTVLHDMVAATDGAMSTSGVVALGNVLYGSTMTAALSNMGAIWSYDLDTSTFTVLANLADEAEVGRWSKSPLSLTPDLRLIGLAWRGGAADNGTIFSYDIKTDQLSALYTFMGAPDGSRPQWGNAATLGRNAIWVSTELGGLNNYGALLGGGIQFPEPATMVSGLIGLLGLAGRKLMRKKKIS